MPRSEFKYKVELSGKSSAKDPALLRPVDKMARRVQPSISLVHLCAERIHLELRSVDSAAGK